MGLVALRHPWLMNIVDVAFLTASFLLLLTFGFCMIYAYRTGDDRRQTIAMVAAFAVDSPHEPAPFSIQPAKVTNVIGNVGHLSLIFTLSFSYDIWGKMPICLNWTKNTQFL